MMEETWVPDDWRKLGYQGIDENWGFSIDHRYYTVDHASIFATHHPVVNLFVSHRFWFVP